MPRIPQLPLAFRVSRRIALALSLLFPAGLVADEPVVETQLLAPANAISVQIATNGRVSAVVRQGSRVVVTIDGEAGPRFDRFLAASGRPMLGREQFPALSSQDKEDHPVMFSSDGSRYGYIGLQGEEYVVIVDGEEVYRAPYEARVVSTHQVSLRFSTQGKHFWFVARHGPDRAYYVFLNGRRLPERLLREDSVLAFTADEERYAIATTNDVKQSQNGRLIIDGKVASYFGVGLEFLPNGKLLSHALRDDGHPLLLLDGKVLNPDIPIRDATVSANNRIAALTSQGVWLDGKIIADTEGAREVVFSPDGKRLAIYGSSGTGRDWLWLDGKRTDHYQAIQPVGPAENRVRAVFTADSAVNLAYAFNGGMYFPLTNGQESDGFKFARDPVTAPSGNRYGYIVTFENQQSGVVVDGELFTSPEWRVGNVFSRPAVVPDSLQFSPDGAHSTFVVGGRDPALYLNGKPVALPEGLIPQPWLVSAYGQGDPTTIVFSPDGKRAAYVGGRKGEDANYVLVDGHMIWTTELGVRRNPTFTPDGKHLFWLNRERAQGRPGSDEVLYANGRRVMALDYQNPLAVNLLKFVGAVQMGADGKLRLIAGSAEGFVRHTITPSAEFDLAAAMSAGPASTVVAEKIEPAGATREEVTPVKVQPVQTVDAFTVPATPTAPVEPLTWTQLVRRREAWPAEAKLSRELRFADGATVRVGSEIAIIELKANEVVASANRGAVTFAVEAEATDVLEAANTAWAALTPEQRELTYAKLARTPELWPYVVKLAVPIELSGVPSLRAGSPVLLLGYEQNQLLVRIPKTDIAFNIEPENTDLFVQARAFLASKQGAPGRLLEEFAAARLVDPTTNRAVRLDLETRPQYVVLYMGAGWCPPCQVFAPKLVQTINDKASAAGDVTFVFLSGDKTPAAAKQYVNGLGIDWPMLAFTNRGQIPAFQSLFGDSIPQLVVTDRHGTVVIDSAKVGQDRALAQLAELL